MSESLPSGTVAFLFTDVEGSTRLWEEHPDAMASALLVHDRVLAEVIAGHGGHVFSTAGDAFCAAFASVAAATSAAAEAQERLIGIEVDTRPLRVRMAIHTGETVERDRNYFGPVLNRAARLMGIGHGGQVLVSQAAASLLPTPETGLVDLGEHRLKDLSLPERVYQLSAGVSDEGFPPLRSLSITRSNLPIQLTAFVGRDSELAEVRRLVDEGRLVTLTGVGGVGKTRLAMQAAADLAERFDGGIWIVELASLTDPELINAAIARVLGIDERAGTDLIQMVIDRIGHRSMLLLLDNCEHLIGDVAKTIESLLAHAAGLKVLATSRELLGVPGEAAYSVPSMLMPSSGDSDIDGALTFDAVQLFITRAATADPSFKLTASNAADVVEICRRLDAIPLALELAASRLRTLTPDQIVAHLDARFRLLTGGSRTALPRQQTLQATLDWSYQLLTETEKTLFRRLSVFAGFDLESAIAVGSDHLIDTYQVVEGIGSLADKSLLTVEESGAGRRYRLLETLRQYGSQKLSETDETDDVRERHARHFAEVAASLGRDLLGEGADHAVERSRVDNDNVLLAVSWAVESGKADLAARIAVGIAPCWEETSIFREPYRWFVQILAMPGEPTEDQAVLGSWAMGFAGWLGLEDDRREWRERVELVRAEILSTRGWLTVQHHLAVALMLERDHLGAYRMLQPLIELAETHDPPYAQPLLHYALSTAFTTGQPDLEDLIDRRVAAAERTGARTHLFYAYGLAASALLTRGNYDRFLPLAHTARAHSVAMGNRFGTAMIDLDLARHAIIIGKLTEARALTLEALETFEELYLQNEIGISVSRMVNIELAADDLEQAKVWARRINLARRLWIDSRLLARLAHRLDRPQDAALLLGFHQHQINARAVVHVFNPDERKRTQDLADQIVEGLGAAASELMDAGASMSEEAAISLAESLLDERTISLSG